MTSCRRCVDARNKERIRFVDDASTSALNVLMASTVDLFLLKPYWLVDRRPFLSIMSFSLLSIIFSNSLPIESSMHNRLYELGSSSGFWFFLNSTSLDRFHALGNMLFITHWFSTLVIVSGLCFASTLTASPGIPSGPGALLEGILAAIPWTSLAVMSSVGSSGDHVIAVLGLCVGNWVLTIFSILPGVLMPGIGCRMPSMPMTYR